MISRSGTAYPQTGILASTDGKRPFPRFARRSIGIAFARSILETEGPELGDRRFDGTVGNLFKFSGISEEDRLSEDLLGSSVGYLADQIPDLCASLLSGKAAHAATSSRVAER